MTDYGYAGSLLRVDLTTGRTSTIPTGDYAEHYLGGRGFAARIFWDDVPAGTPFDHEDNRLIIALGPLAGIPALGGSRWAIYSTSPHPSPQNFCYGNCGGRWGAELKFTGYDGIVILGKSDTPVTIVIKNDSVEISDASDIWGRGAIETRDILEGRMGKNIRVLAIGPAGENMARDAIVLADGDASCSGGMGAVMGSKKVKAIVTGASSRGVSVAQPDKLKEIADRIRGFGRGNVKVWGFDFMAQGPKTKKAPCYGCMGHCLRVKYKADNGTTGKFMCQSRFFYLPYAWAYHGEDNDVPFLANKLCDQYGLDTWTLQQTLEWLIRCHQAGVITEEQTGLPFSAVGSLEFIENLVKMISLRQGFGEIIADGAERAAKELGSAAEGQIRYVDPYEPRIYTTNTLIYPFEPREPIQQVHEVGLTLAQWSSWAKGSEGAHISSEVLKGIAKTFWGSEAAADMTTYDGKALAAKLIQERQYVKECLIVCDWMYPVVDIPNSDDHVGDPDLERAILAAVMGREIEKEELNCIGERVLNLQRAILLRNGRRPLHDDRLPEEWHASPMENHSVDGQCLAPDGDGKAVSRKGAVIENGDYENLREEYYILRKWDPESGLQTRDGLGEIGLADITEELENLSLLAE